MNTLASFYTYTTTTTTTSSSHAWSGLFLGYLLVVLVLVVIILVSEWIVFKKAGKPGWAVIVPVYNLWVLFEIVGYPGWWAILALIPFVNIFTVIMEIISIFKLGKLFGKSSLFSVLLVLFPFVCLPILAFGKATFSDSKPKSPGSGGESGPVSSSPTPQQPTATPIQG